MLPKPLDVTISPFADLRFNDVKSTSSTYLEGVGDNYSESRPGCVYVVKNDYLPFVKIGRWSGSLGALQSRYFTVYGRNTAFYTYAVKDTKLAERKVKNHFQQYNVTGELFRVDDVTTAMWYVLEIVNLLKDMD